MHQLIILMYVMFWLALLPALITALTHDIIANWLNTFFRVLSTTSVILLIICMSIYLYLKYLISSLKKLNHTLISMLKDILCVVNGKQYIQPYTNRSTGYNLVRLDRVLHPRESDYK